MSKRAQLLFVAALRIALFIAVFQLMHAGWGGQFAAAFILLLMSPRPEGL